MPTLDVQPKSAISARRRNKSRVFLCFGAAGEEENEVEESRRGSANSNESSPDNRSRKQQKDSNRLLEQKGADSPVKKLAAESSGKSTDSEERPSVFSSVSSSSSPSPSFSSSASASSFSSSSSASSSSSSSHLSLGTSSGFPDSPEPKEPGKMVAKSRNRPPPALGGARNRGSVTGAFLLIISLTMTVFYGRLCAIVWTSSWLCFVARRNSRGGTASDEEEDVMEAAAVEVILKAVGGKLCRRGAEEESVEKGRVAFEGPLQSNRKV